MGLFILFSFIASSESAYDGKTGSKSINAYMFELLYTAEAKAVAAPRE